MSTTSSLTSLADVADAEPVPLPPPPTAVPAPAPAPSSGSLQEEVDGVSNGLQTLTFDAKKEQENEKLIAAGDGEEDDSEEINWVEMPREHLLWILGKTFESDPVPTLEDFGLYTQEDIDREDADGLIRKTIASLQAGQDEFFAYQAWVREVFTRNGRVMVPEDVFGPKDVLQQQINEYWYKDGDSDSEEVALPSK